MNACPVHRFFVGRFLVGHEDLAYTMTEYRPQNLPTMKKTKKKVKETLRRNCCVSVKITERRH